MYVDSNFPCGHARAGGQILNSNLGLSGVLGGGGGLVWDVGWGCGLDLGGLRGGCFKRGGKRWLSAWSMGHGWVYFWMDGTGGG